jgi:hypothetical protein
VPHPNVAPFATLGWGFSSRSKQDGTCCSIPEQPYGAFFATFAPTSRTLRLKAFSLLFLEVRVGKLFAETQRSCLEQALEAYIDFAIRNPRDYDLYYAPQHESLRPPESRSANIGPGFVWVQQKLVERLGGSAQDHAALVLSLWALAHGTVTLLTSKVVPAPRAAELRAGCAAAVRILLQNAESRR